MLNRKITKMIHDVERRIQPTWLQLLNEFGLPDTIPFNVVDSITDWSKGMDRCFTMTDLADSIMVAVGCPLSENGIIVAMEGGVVMAYSSLLHIVMGFDFNIELTTMYIRFAMRHEIGHLIDYSRMVGKPVIDWERWSDETQKEVDDLDMLRKNASLKSVLEYRIAYNNCSAEYSANFNAGITDKDIAITFILSNPYVKYKKSGCDKYLSHDEFDTVIRVRNDIINGDRECTDVKVPFQLISGIL